VQASNDHIAPLKPDQKILLSAPHYLVWGFLLFSGVFNV